MRQKSLFLLILILIFNILSGCGESAKDKEAKLKLDKQKEAYLLQDRKEWKEFEETGEKFKIYGEMNQSEYKEIIDLPRIGETDVRTFLRMIATDSKSVTNVQLMSKFFKVKMQDDPMARYGVTHSRILQTPLPVKNSFSCQLQPLWRD